MIPLTKGAEAIVDDADYTWLSQHNWQLSHNGYAYGRVGGRVQYMHRLILGVASGEEIDHIDRNKLNNCRGNLRICSRAANLHNRAPKGHTSKYKGVCFEKFTGRWLVQIRANGKRIKVGRFDNEIDAAKAYDIAAKRYHGDFAFLNFSEQVVGISL